MHPNARLTYRARLTLVQRICSGRPPAHVASEMGVSRQTAYKWLARWRTEGEDGLRDRPSRPHRSPNRVPISLERAVVALRRSEKLGPVRIAARLSIPASTAHRVLCRLELNRIDCIDRPSGQPIRRYEHAAPGDLLHIDVKKLGRMPEGGGWRAHGRGKAKRSRAGYAFIHSAVDDHSRLAYSEVLSRTRRNRHRFPAPGVRLVRQPRCSDTHCLHRQRRRLPQQAIPSTCRSVGIRSKRTRPYRPQTNGKVERFHRTMLNEWAYVRLYQSEAERTAAPDLGCICIITTVVTPQSEVSRPSPVSTTSLDTTPSPPRWRAHRRGR